MQEAKDSSEIENIFTTHEQLFESRILDSKQINQSAKEIENYRAALWMSYQNINSSGLIRLKDILDIEESWYC